MIDRAVDDIRHAAMLADEVDLDELAAAIDDELSTWLPLPHQRLPDDDWWRVHLFEGGRGAGKTDAGAYATDQHMQGPPCDPRVPGGHRALIVGPTFADAVESCYRGPSGLHAHNHDTTLVTRQGVTLVEWPNGSEARVLGAFTPEDAERPRAAGNRCWVWGEEVAAWRMLRPIWNNLVLGLRLGDRPRFIGTSTPRNRDLLHEWAETARRPVDERDGLDRVVITRATTDDNPFLHVDVRRALFDRYGDTRLGRQELLGELLDDVGTYFQRAWWRVVDDPPNDRPFVCRYWDLAATPPGPTNEDPDWTVGVRIVFEPRDRMLTIEDLVRCRESSGTVESTVLATAEQDGPRVTQIIEQDPGQAGKDQVARYRSKLQALGVPVDSERPTGSKELRAQATVIAAEQGRVRLVRAGWNAALIDEHEDFPDGAHDDIVDAVSGAITWLETRGGSGRARSIRPTGSIPPRLHRVR